jgi:hypothetical protein
VTAYFVNTVGFYKMPDGLWASEDINGDGFITLDEFSMSKDEL